MPRQLFLEERITQLPPHEHPGRSHSLGIKFTSTKNPAHARTMYCRYNTKEGVSVSRGGGYWNTQQTGKKSTGSGKRRKEKFFLPPLPFWTRDLYDYGAISFSPPPLPRRRSIGVGRGGGGCVAFAPCTLWWSRRVVEESRLSFSLFLDPLNFYETA